MAVNDKLPSVLSMSEGRGRSTERMLTQAAECLHVLYMRVPLSELTDAEEDRICNSINDLKFMLLFIDR